MNLLRVRDSIPQWPYTVAMLQADEPRLSISQQPHASELAALATLDPPVLVYKVQPSPPPAYNQAAQRVVQIMPELVEGQWQQRWGVEDLPPPAPNYEGFYNDLIAHSVYELIALKASLFQPLLAASTEFIAAFSDAKAGRPNPEAIRMTVWKLIYWLQPSESEAAAIQAMLVANHLDELYSIQIPTEILDLFDAQPNPFRFYAGILNSNFYQQKLVPIILSGSSSVPGDATTIMGFAIKDAQSGLVPPPTPGDPPNSLQMSLWIWMAAVGPQLGAEDIAEIQGLLDAANLSSAYSLTPPEAP
jgi:hypothetical protein